MSTLPDDSRLDALMQEFMDRQRAGERPTAEDYAARNPQMASAIRDLFPALEVLEEFGSVASPPTGPFAVSAAASPEHLGDYRILRVLGRGGMGVVYEAIQESLGRHVALKVLPPHARENRVYLERFQREAKAAARLHHTNIVPVFGTGVQDGVPYYAMQFIRGQPLDAVLKELRRLDKAPDDTATLPPDRSVAQGLLTGRFERDGETLETPPSEGSSLSLHGNDAHKGRFYRSVAEVGAQVADALAYAHSQGVVHRDVKPSNLLLDARGTVWVTDFGLAKAEGSEELTTSGDILGTLRFMSPEQLEGRAEPRSDVYSLGVTLYELATLRPAFDDPVRVRLLNLVRTADPPRPRRLRPDMPRDLETVILKAMAKEPHRRYDSAQALADDLRRVTDDLPVRARRVRWAESAWRWGRRNPGKSAMLAGLLSLALVIGIGGWVAAGQLSRQKRAEAAARRDAQVALWRAELSEARGLTISRRPGQRFRALTILRTAMARARELGLSDDDRAAFRNVAATALALPDMDEVRSWRGMPNGGGGSYHQFAFDERHERYVHADSDGNVILRDVAGEKERSRLTGFTTQPELLLSPDATHLAVWARLPEDLNGTLSVYALGWDAPRLVFRHPTPTFPTVAFSPDSRRVAYMTVDRKSVFVRDVRSGDVRQWKPENHVDGNVSFSPDGRRLAVPVFESGKGTIHFCDPDTGTVFARLGLNGKCWHHSWHPDGQLFVTGGEQFEDELWDLSTGQCLATLPGHAHSGGFVQFTPDGDHFFSHDWSGRMRLVEVTSGRTVLTFPSVGITYNWAADGRHVGTAGDKQDDRLRILKYEPGRELRTIRPLVRGSYASVKWERIVAGGPDHLIATTVTDPKVPYGHRGVALIDRRTGRAVAEIDLPGTLPLHISPEGHVFTEGPDGLLEWPRTRHKGVLQFGPPRVRLPPVVDGESRRATGGNGHLIAEANLGDGLRVIPHIGEPVVTPPPGFQCRRAVVSPEGRWVVAGSFGKPADGHGVKVFDAATGRLVATLRVDGNSEVGFSPDGRRLWTTGGGGATFRTDTWAAGPVLGGHRIAFSPDASVAAVGDGLGLIRLHDAETGAELVRLATHEQGRLYPIGFSPDGAELVTVSEVGQELQVWDLRRIREGLAELGLDWEATAYPSATPAESPATFAIEYGRTLLNQEARRAARENRPKDAAAAGLKSLASDPNQLDLYPLVLGHINAARINDPKTALPLATKLTELRPAWEHFELRAKIQTSLKDDNAALTDLNRALDLCPLDRSEKRAELFHLRSHSHQYLGDITRADADIDAAIRLKSTDPHFFAMRAGFRTTLSRPADAIADWKKVTELESDSRRQGTAWRALATLFVSGPNAVRDAKAGLAAAERAAALEKEPGAETRHLLGAAHVRNGNHAKAVQTLVVAKAPGAFAGLNDLYLAMAYHHLGEADKARAAFATALTWRKSNPTLTATAAARFETVRTEAEEILGRKP